MSGRSVGPLPAPNTADSTLFGFRLRHPDLGCPQIHVTSGRRLRDQVPSQATQRPATGAGGALEIGRRAVRKPVDFGVTAAAIWPGARLSLMVEDDQDDEQDDDEQLAVRLASALAAVRLRSRDPEVARARDTLKQSMLGKRRKPKTTSCSTPRAVETNNSPR